MSRHAHSLVVVRFCARTAVAAIRGVKNVLEKPGACVFLETNQPHRLSGAMPDAQVVEIEVRRPR